jgi:hypothetical protein
MWMPRFSKVLVKMPHNLLSASTTMMRGRPLPSYRTTLLSPVAGFCLCLSGVQFSCSSNLLELAVVGYYSNNKLAYQVLRVLGVQARLDRLGC